MVPFEIDNLLLPALSRAGNRGNWDSNYELEIHRLVLVAKQDGMMTTIVNVAIVNAKDLFL